MRVLFDGYWWFEGPPSGRMVLREIVQHWGRRFPEDELIVAVPDRELISNTNADASPLRLVGTKRRLHPLINVLELPRIAKRERADFVFAQNFAPPVGRSAVFVFDVLFQSNPDWFTRKERLYFSLIPKLMRRADVVFTCSGSEAERIQRFNTLPEPPLGFGLAVPTELRQSEPKKPPIGLSEGNFVLCVGRLNARKNLERTIRAALRSGNVNPQRPLVVIGENSGKVSDLNAEFCEAVSNRVVLFPGFASNEELRWLYENCSGFVCMSLDEGYGLPPLEALTFGARVVASDIQVFRENLNGYASYADPRNEDDIAQKIAELLMVEHSHESGASNASHPPSGFVEPEWGDIVDQMRDAVVARLYSPKT